MRLFRCPCCAFAPADAAGGGAKKAAYSYVSVVDGKPMRRASTAEVEALI